MTNDKVTLDLFRQHWPAPINAMRMARERGSHMAGLAEEKAEADAPGFVDRARVFIVDYLRRHGPTSGELVTDAMTAAGIRPKDDRAFGGVYAGLVRGKKIRCTGYTSRRKGNGTGGARIWEAV
jgi:hypothetical protein